MNKSLRGAYKSLTCVTKAIDMLKYSGSDYKASLTEQQSRLMLLRWATYDGFTDFAEDIRKHSGISDRIQDEINKLVPQKRSRGMYL